MIGSVVTDSGAFQLSEIIFTNSRMSSGGSLVSCTGDCTHDSAASRWRSGLRRQKGGMEVHSAGLSPRARFINPIARRFATGLANKVGPSQAILGQEALIPPTSVDNLLPDIRIAEKMFGDAGR